MAADWQIFAQLTDGSDLELRDGRQLRFSWDTFSTDVPLSSWAKESHVVDSDGNELCLFAHAHSTRFVDATHVSLDGAASSLLTGLTTAQATLRLVATLDRDAAVSGAKFYAYDGTTDANAPSGAALKAYEVGHGSSWATPGGSAGALLLADQAHAVVHTWYIAVSLSPSAPGVDSVRFKAIVPYA
jgi:hypothetical protein